MSPKLEDFLSDPTAVEKELTRKLYWAISSTVPLGPEQKKTAFSWASGLAERIIAKAATSPPPAFRALEVQGRSSKSQAVAKGGENRQNGQAGGGGARGSNGRRTVPPITHRRLEGSPRPSEKFLETQARLKAAAILYAHTEALKLGIN